MSPANTIRHQTSRFDMIQSRSTSYGALPVTILLPKGPLRFTRRYAALITVDSQMCNAISPPPPFFRNCNCPKFQDSSTFGKIKPRAANQSHHFLMLFNDSHFCFIKRQGEISAWADKWVRVPPRHPLIKTDNEKKSSRFKAAANSLAL